MSFPSVRSEEGRKAWAFAAIVGGCMVFTGFAGVGVYLVRNHTGFAFWLALAAHGQVLVGMGAIGWVLGRRMNLEATKDGVKMIDPNGEGE